MGTVELSPHSALTATEAFPCPTTLACLRFLDNGWNTTGDSAVLEGCESKGSFLARRLLKSLHA